MSLVSEASEVCDDVVGLIVEQGRQGRALKARIGPSKDKSDSLKQKKSADCDMKIVSCKVADAKSDRNNLVYILCQETLESYTSIRHNFDLLLV